MKKAIFFISAILMLSCTNKTKEKDKLEQPEINSTENFDWLLGNWQRLNNEVGEQTFENWKRINETEYFGVGFTLKNGDTISKENMQLAKLNDVWNLSVSFPTERNATVFKITHFDKNSFVCENDLNDFPKKIHYWFENQKLKANISNSEMAIDFEFGKVKK